MAVGVYDRHWNSTEEKFVLQSETLELNDLDHRVVKYGTVVGSGAPGYYIVDETTEQIATDVSTNGWYFRLLGGKERCLGDFLVYQETVFFISFTSDVSDPCIIGGLSNLYGVYYTSGTSTTSPLFDLTGEGIIDSGDLVEDTATNKKFGPAIMKLDKGFAGGKFRIKGDKGYTPLPKKPMVLNLPGEDSSTGVTSWREVLQ